jgi:hypothetical protein
MLSKDSIVAVRDQNVLSSTVEEQTVLLNLEKGSYYTLDLVGADVWQMLREPIRVGEIITRLLQEYEATPEQIEEDVFSLLKDLEHEGLIQIDGQPAASKRSTNSSLRDTKASQQNRNVAPGSASQPNAEKQNKTEKRGGLFSRISKFVDRH